MMKANLALTSVKVRLEREVYVVRYLYFLWTIMPSNMSKPFILPLCQFAPFLDFERRSFYWSSNHQLVNSLFLLSKIRIAWSMAFIMSRVLAYASSRTLRRSVVFRNCTHSTCSADGVVPDNPGNVVEAILIDTLVFTLFSFFGYVKCKTWIFGPCTCLWKCL